MKTRLPRSIRVAAVAGALLATALALALATVAADVSATPARTMPGKIVPGKSIGQIRLGMNSRDALRILRRYATPILIDVVRRRSGSLYIEYEYRVPDEFGAPAYTLAVQGVRGKRRVVLIKTLLPRHRTAEGVGVGSTTVRLVRAFGARIRCQGNGIKYGTPGTACLLGSAARRHTVFLMPGKPWIPGRAPDDSPSTVSSVTVQEPGVRTRAR